MYVNDRDQINYHGFLRALRDMNNVQQHLVSIGVCTVSGMNRFENGNRVAEKLMRDRLTARLGISGEKYEDYLQRSEYRRWQHRLCIIKAIEKKDLMTAKAEVEEYAILKGLNVVNKQFVETMRFMILSLENASKEELLDCVNKAIKYTVPNVKKALDGAHLLSDQEVNLIAEQMRLLSPKAVVRDEVAWHIAEYEKLIDYMDRSKWETLQKAKVYPKVVYYICQLLLEKECTEDNLRYGLKLCHTAIELLRDSARLYYFIELTEIRRIFAARLLSCVVDSSERNELEEMLLENNSWENVFKELYKEYDVATYMSNFCYLYQETECHDMAEVIELRRNMFGLSRVNVSKDICTERTIIRFEREGRDPNIEVVRRLFEKLGLCAEYRRAQIITTDVKALMLYNEDLLVAVNDDKFERAFECVEELKSTINMDIPYNKQELKRIENFLLNRSKRISAEKFETNIIDSLEFTVKSSVLENSKENFFTRSELLCIHDLAFDIKTSVSTVCLSIVEGICNEKRIDRIESRFSMKEWLLVRLYRRIGDEGRYKESRELSNAILKECLEHYRMVNLWDNVYNNIWNCKQENNQYDLSTINDGIKMCIILSQIIKEYNVAAFFQEKLKEL